MRAFLVVWAGPTLSALGSSLLAFALGVWVFQRTGSAGAFGATVFCAVVPHVLLAPVAGVLVDRWPRRRMMMACDLGAALVALALAAIVGAREPTLAQVYALIALGAVFNCFHQLAYAAAMTGLLPDAGERARGNGLVQLGLGLAFVAGPLLAGALLTVLPLGRLILIDCASFLVAWATLLLVRMPEPVAAHAPERRGVRAEFRAGLAVIRAEPALLALLFVVAASNGAIGLTQVLFTPMVLTVSSATVLGVLLSLGGAGMVLGGVVASVWRPADPVRGVRAALALGGFAMVVGGVRASAWLWGVGVVGFFVSVPLLTASLQNIWQQRVPAPLQGRVFAVRSIVAAACLPLAYLGAPWLATHAFEPWLAPAGALATSAGAIVGTGSGRGIALMFVLAGLSLVGLAAATARLVRGAERARENAATAEAAA
jgi:MFS family permease